MVPCTHTSALAARSARLRLDCVDSMSRSPRVPATMHLDAALKDRLNAVFAPKATKVEARGSRGFARRGSISDAAADIIASKRRGSVIQLAGVMAAALENAGKKDEASPAEKKNATGLSHAGSMATSVLIRSADEVTGRFGYLIDHDYLGIMKATGYNRRELYDLFLQFKALACLSSSTAGVDRDTFIQHTPMLVMEDPAFKGRVFDLLDTDGSGTIEWEEYLTAMNILATAEHKGPRNGGKSSEGTLSDMSISFPPTESLLKQADQFQFAGLDVNSGDDSHNANTLEGAARSRAGSVSNAEDMDLTMQRQDATGIFRRCTDVLSQRKLTTEFLFKCYDKGGNGSLSMDELYHFLLDSFFIDKEKAEARYGECANQRSQEREARRGQIMTAEERSAHYVRTHFGREEPFGDNDADTVAIFRDVCSRVFDKLDDNHSGSVSLREAVDYIVSHPEISDVSSIFGRAMISGPAADVRKLVLAQHVEEEKKAKVDWRETERRRQAVFESLYRGGPARRAAVHGQGQVDFDQGQTGGYSGETA